MTTDLWCLVANAIWGWALVSFEGSAKTRAAGLEWNQGNRETEPDVPAWVKRCGRAIANHKENFPFFLTAVVVVHLAGKADRWSAIAAVLYVIARALHGVLYTAGVTRLRSLAYLVGIGATFAIVSRLVL